MKLESKHTLNCKRLKARWMLLDQAGMWFEALGRRGPGFLRDATARAAEDYLLEDTFRCRLTIFVGRGRQAMRH